MKVNHPSSHILRAKRCRDSLARSPLASAATRDGAATGDDVDAREARDGDARRRERTSRASMGYIRNRDLIAEDEANRARIDEAARRREGDGGSASMRARGSEGDPWAEYAAAVERMIFENRSAGQKRRRAREAALGSPPMMRRRRKRGAVDGGEDATATAAIEHDNHVDDIASDDEGDAAGWNARLPELRSGVLRQAVAFEGWRAKKERRRFASPDVVHTFKAMLWSAVQRPFGSENDEFIDQASSFDDFLVPELASASLTVDTSCPIGTGAFSEVFIGIYDGDDVICKRFRSDVRGRDVESFYVDELESARALKTCSGVAPFIGACGLMQWLIWKNVGTMTLENALDLGDNALAMVRKTLNREESDVATLRFLAREMFEATASVHGFEFIHRDIKPANAITHNRVDKISATHVSPRVIVSDGETHRDAFLVAGTTSERFDFNRFLYFLHGHSHSFRGTLQSLSNHASSSVSFENLVNRTEG